jgi:hypothetical protein
MPIINASGQTRFGVRNSATLGLLETYGSSAAAYSLRKLKNSYTGYAIQVRRSSDSYTQDIGFDANGNLDTTSLLSFVGSGNGFVTTWYDQSGNSKHATQISATTQPQIVSSGSLITSNNRASIRFTSGAFLTSPAVNRTNTNDAMSMYGVYKLLSIARQSQFKWGNTEIEPGANANGVALTQFGSFSYSPNSSEYWSTNLALVSVIFTGGLITNTNIYYNGTYRASNITNGSNGNLQTGGVITIGKGIFSNGNSNISELLFYPTGSQNANVNEINTNINNYYSIWDIDAEKFITAATLTGSQANSIRTLVPALKSANIWTKMKAIYPFVGGTAARHKWNLKDPRDLDEAYRLVFSGGWTYWPEGPLSSYGIADTKFNPATVFGATNSNVSFGVYQAGGMNGNGHGAWSNSGTRRMAIYESNGGFLRSQITSATAEAVSPDMRGVTNGFIIANRNSVNSNKIWRHGVLQGTNTVTETALLPNANITLCNVNGNVSSGYVNTTLYFAYISQGLTDTEVSALHSAVQTFRVSLGYYI